MDTLEAGDKVTIAGKEYTIGSTKTDAEALLDKADAAATAAGAGNSVDVELTEQNIRLHLKLVAILLLMQLVIQLLT